jgi:hypothetical protein
VRNRCADRARATVLVGIHMNGYRDPAAAGVETIYCRERPSAPAAPAWPPSCSGLCSPTSADAASRPSPIAARSRTGAASTRPLTAAGAAYGHLLELVPVHATWLKQASTMPGAILEPLFLTNAPKPRDPGRPARDPTRDRPAARPALPLPLRIQQQQHARDRQPARLHRHRLDHRHPRLGRNQPAITRRASSPEHSPSSSQARSSSCTSAPTPPTTPPSTPTHSPPSSVRSAGTVTP